MLWHDKLGGFSLKILGQVIFMSVSKIPPLFRKQLYFPNAEKTLKIAGYKIFEKNKVPH
jgi:hypothetical protein